MSTSFKSEETRRPTLGAATAADLMTPNPLSIRAGATVSEVVAFLVDKGISAAPVIDEAGRPVGVLSRSDILVHDRELEHALAVVPSSYEDTEPSGAFEEILPTGLAVERTACARARDVMTPVVYSVTLEVPAAEVVEQMVAAKVHRLFVVDAGGALVGVISALDVLRHLRPAAPA